MSNEQTGVGGYYFFDQCPPEAVSELERVAKEYNMTKQSSDSDYIIWSDDPNGNGMHISYQPNHHHSPLGLQTPTARHHDEDPSVLLLIKQIISVTGSQQVYDALMNKFDMTEFQ